MAGTYRSTAGLKAKPKKYYVEICLSRRLKLLLKQAVLVLDMFSVNINDDTHLSVASITS